MQVQKSQLSDSRIKLTVEADQELLEDVKRETLLRLKRDVKIPGFRTGKVPLELVEKNINSQTLQSEFIDAALNRMYSAALGEQNVRPVAQPQVSIKKFVPFTTLEFEAEVDIIGQITLPNYKKITVARKTVEVTDKDVNEVIQNLRTRMAAKQPAQRPAQNDDEVIIDFAGRDTKTHEPIHGGEGKAFPLVLGSNSFIPGFEGQLIGAVDGEDREFTLEFPKDYGVKTLQGRKVTFKVTVHTVNEVTLPDLNDDFASKAGPFKTLAELKADIKKQISSEHELEAERNYESDLLSKITEQAKVAVPDPLIDEEVIRLEDEERQNIIYRGQTWEEHLADEGISAEEHRSKNRPSAQLRVRAGLVLAEIAEQEKIEVTPAEFDMRLELMKGQYQDSAMQAELDKPENRRELASRLLSEKTITKLVSYATAAAKTTKTKPSKT
jgi:trigger factor